MRENTRKTKKKTTTTTLTLPYVRGKRYPLQIFLTVSQL